MNSSRVVRSYSYLQSTLATLRRRLAQAEEALVALTPPRQRGKGQIESESALCAAIAQIEQRYDVHGCFLYAYHPEVTERTVRAYKGKPAHVVRRVRYHLTVARHEAAITDVEAACGWRIYATNAPAERLSLTTAVLTYRDQIVHENIFRRLHGKALSLTPLYVQREDHAQGLIHLLTIAARFLALGDYLARKALAHTETALAGVYAGNANRSTARPTTERMLNAFAGISLLILPQGERCPTLLIAFTQLHAQILPLLGLAPALFANLQAT
ncbi:MAG: transposase [Caldilineaceae bacterium]